VINAVLNLGQLSLTEASLNSQIQSAGDGYAALKKQLHSPIMKLKFVSEKTLQSNR